MCGINHLAGLDLPVDALAGLTSDEREVLATFRRQYDLHRRRKKREKKKTLADVRLATLEPAYEYLEDLPESGWRPVDDITLYRYLCADRHKDGSFDLDASHQRLLGAMQFRREYSCDLIVKNVLSNSIPPNVGKCRTFKVGIYAGTDCNHRPVVFERLGEFFGSGNSQRASEEDWITTYLYFLETHFAKMRESAKEHNVPVQKIMYYADFSGINSAILSGKIWSSIGLMHKIVKLVECHYPEIVEKITLFKVPFIMSASFNAVKGFLDPTTAGKIELFSGVPLNRFLDTMSEENIPVEYGGKNEIEYPTTCY